jgi:hypothetical protein
MVVAGEKAGEGSEMVAVVEALVVAAGKVAEEGATKAVRAVAKVGWLM